jgi:hypothetical protein
MHYTPGPKARTEYAVFMRQPGADAAAALAPLADEDQEDLVATVTREPPAAAAHLPLLAEASPPTPVLASPAAEAAPLADSLRTQAHALVMAFYQRFHGVTAVTPHPKELAHATELLATHGEAQAHFLLPFAHEAAGATHYQPQTFGGIVHYLPRALAAYDRQATQATTQQAAATDRTKREQYAQWRQQALAQLRDTQPPEELATLEATQQARLVAAGTPAFALGFALRMAMDEALEAQAGLPAFDAWRQTQEDA